LGSVNKFREVILVTGTPGVGKTTVAHRLAAKMTASCIGITELVKSENLAVGRDDDRATLIADTKKVSKQLQEIVDSSEEKVIIVEGHYAVDVAPEKGVKKVFVLRLDPNELKDILEKRGYAEKKLWENLAAEILDVCLYDAISVCGADKVCEIDVTGKTVEAVVEEALLVLEKKQECRVGVVDWLGKLEKEGKLGKFLKRF
jgi:adenylate kinase